MGKYYYIYETSNGIHHISRNSKVAETYDCRRVKRKKVDKTGIPAYTAKLNEGIELRYFVSAIMSIPADSIFCQEGSCNIERYDVARDIWFTITDAAAKEISTHQHSFTGYDEGELFSFLKIDLEVNMQHVYEWTLQYGVENGFQTTYEILSLLPTNEMVDFTDILTGSLKVKSAYKTLRGTLGIELGDS